MNVRKPVDYSAMFAALDSLMKVFLTQMELYCEIGKLVSARPEKGAAVAAAEYLSMAYPDARGFSPRNLRRMRDFCRAYGDAPEVMAEAMTIGWTRNVAILEGCEGLEERAWYIQAVRRFGWTKAELLEKIQVGAYQESGLNTTLAAEELAAPDSASQNINAQADFSRLDLQEMIYWDKQSSQRQRKDGADYGPAIIQNQCCDRPRPAGPVREYPELAETRLLPPVGPLSAQRRMRPCMPSLRPPADRKNDYAPPGCAGYDPGGCGENGIGRAHV